MSFTSEIGEFKGNKTFSVTSGDKRIITFGVNKAKAILAVIKDLEKFVQDNDSSNVKEKDLSLNTNSLTTEQLSLISQFLRNNS